MYKEQLLFKDCDSCAHLYSSTLFSHKAEGQHDIEADTSDQDSGDTSSATISAASCLGNLRLETHLHHASSIAVLIYSLFYREALDIQKLSLGSKLICKESKLKPNRLFYAICQSMFIS